MIAILTPTFRGHFDFISEYIKSINENALNKQELKIYFVLSGSEIYEFEERFSSCLKGSIDYELINFDELLENKGFNLTSEEALRAFDKYTYQTLKKLLAIEIIPCEDIFVVDSESKIIAPVDLCEIKNEYYKRGPWGLYSKVNKRKINAEFFLDLVHLHSKILGIEEIWFLEHVQWIFKKSIILDLINHFGGINNLLRVARASSGGKTAHLFEGLLYYGWIWKNKDKYKFNFYDVDELLDVHLTKIENEKYNERFFSTYRGQAGKIEFALSMLTKENVYAFIDLYSTVGVRVLRCENTSISNYFLQKRLLKDLDIRVLTCSQDHWHGLNRTGLLDRIKDRKRISRYWNRFKDFKREIKYLVYLVMNGILACCLVLLAPLKVQLFKYLERKYK